MGTLPLVPACIVALALVPALRAGLFQQINLYCSSNEYTEHVHVPSTVGELLS